MLNVLLKQAVEWGVLDKMPCSIRLVRVPRTDAAFHDFDDYQRLLKAAQTIDPRSYLIALLGGEAGLRAGEIVALEWADVDFERRQIRVRHSDWCGELTAPKNGRIRFVGMTERLAATIRRPSTRRSACSNGDLRVVQLETVWRRRRSKTRNASRQNEIVGWVLGTEFATGSCACHERRRVIVVRIADVRSARNTERRCPRQ